MTTVIANDMGGAMEGGEYSAALWTLGLLLFVISFILIFIIHHFGKRSHETERGGVSHERFST